MVCWAGLASASARHAAKRQVGRLRMDRPLSYVASCAVNYSNFSNAKVLIGRQTALWVLVLYISGKGVNQALLCLAQSREAEPRFVSSRTDQFT